MRQRCVHVTIGPEVAETLDAAAAAATPQETGGVLLGWWDAGQPMVRYAIEVTDPEASGTTWSRSEASAQCALDTALAALHHPWLGYVGDWHTHTRSCGPSRQDERSIAWASQAYRHPLVLIVRQVDGRLHVRAAQRGRRRPSVLRHPIES